MKKKKNNYYISPNNSYVMVFILKGHEAEVKFLLLSTELISSLFENPNANDTTILKNHSPIFIWGEQDEHKLVWRYMILGDKHQESQIVPKIEWNFQKYKYHAGIGTGILVVVGSVLIYLFG